MPDDIEALRQRIEVLEFQLAEALRVDCIAPLQLRYGLTRQQAALLALLLDGRQKPFEAFWPALNSPDPTTTDHIRVQLYRVRKAIPWARIKSIRCFGFQMEKETVERIKSEIAAE